MGEIPKQFLKYVFKKGHKGMGGRPKGQSVKEFSREHFSKMTPEEKLKFINSVDPDLVWRMGEGNPETKVNADLNVKVEKLEEIQKATQALLDE